MTTSDNAIGSERQPRPIEELAKLDSYQGMTDEEINMVMQYRLEIAIKDSAYQAALESQRKTEQAKIESYRTLANHAKERLNELTAAPLQLGIITEEEA
jgi:hypothetical protein